VESSFQMRAKKE